MAAESKPNRVAIMGIGSEPVGALHCAKAATLSRNKRRGSEDDARSYASGRRQHRVLRHAPSTSKLASSKRCPLSPEMPSKPSPQPRHASSPVVRGFMTRLSSTPRRQPASASTASRGEVWLSRPIKAKGLALWRAIPARAPCRHQRPGPRRYRHAWPRPRCRVL